MTPALQMLLMSGFNPYGMDGTAARYSLDGAPSYSTYLIDGSNRIQLIADRSGNSAVNGLVLNGASGNYASAPDSAAVSVTGDIDLRSLTALNVWPPVGDNTLIAKYGAAGHRSFSFFCAASTGTMWFAWSNNGTAVLSASSTVTPTIIAGVPMYFRVTRSAASGDVFFYTSTDETSWTQIGAKISTTPNTIFDSDAIVEIGSNSSGTGSLLSGTTYRAQIYNGIAGTLVFDANFTRVAKLAASFTESSSNVATVTINTSGDLGARISGARDLVQLTVAKQPIYSVSGGYAIATGDGVDDYMKAAGWTMAQPVSLYLAGSQIAFTNGDTFTDGNASNTGSIYQAGGSPSLGLYAGGGACFNTDLAVSTNGVMTALFNAAASQLRINAKGAMTGNPGSGNMNGFTLWSDAAGTSEWANLAVSEIIIRSTADTDSIQLKIARFLMKKWGVAA